MTIKLYDTNQSYRLRIRLAGLAFRVDWWYYRAARRWEWMPLEIRRSR